MGTMYVIIISWENKGEGVDFCWGCSGGLYSNRLGNAQNQHEFNCTRET